MNDMTELLEQEGIMSTEEERDKFVRDFYVFTKDINEQTGESIFYYFGPLVALVLLSLA